MQKVKKYSRQILVFILALATALMCFLILAPQADAADGVYKYKVEVNITDSCKASAGHVKLYYKTQNGINSSETELVITENSGMWNSKQVHTFEGTCSGFPVRVNTRCKMGRFRGVTYYCTLYVYNNNTGAWVKLGESGKQDYSNKDRNADTNADTSLYPYVSTAAFSVSNPVYVNTDGSKVDKTVSVSATDQYGVGWVNAPSSWSKSSSNVTLSGSGKSITASFNNTSDSKDYTTTFSSTWSTANPSYSSVTKTSGYVQVYVPHTLTVDTNGGSTVNNVTGKYTGNAVTLTSPTKTAYDFTGWTLTSGVGSVSGSTYTFGNGNGAVRAIWTPHTYTINYSPDGGSVSQDSETYNVESTSLTLPTPTRTGYTFKGWTVSNADGNWTVGEPVTNTISGKYGNITVKANWEANQYTLSYNLNDTDRQGTASCSETSKTVTYDSAVGELPTPTMTAYQFDGWFTAATGGTQVTASTVYQTASNTTVYAHWTPINYTVTYDVNGGDALTNLTYTIESGTLPLPTRTGYTFAGWEVVTASGNWTTGDKLASGTSLVGKYGDVTLKALWTANSYTATLDLNDGNRVGTATCEKDSISATYDSTLGELPVPELTAYTFDGWFTAAEGGTQVTAATVYKTAGDTTYYAHWTPITYTATFDPNQGQFDGMALNEKKTIDYNIETSEFIFPSCTRVGYTFEYWITAVSADSNWTANDTYDAGETLTNAHMYGDVTFAAKWDDNTYTLTFNVDTDAFTEASCETATMFVTYDSAVGEMPVPTRDAYDFDGWFLADGTTEITAETVWKIADNTTVYAHWTPIVYTISYNVTGGDALEPTTYTIEDDLFFKEPTKTGYTFNQWINQTANTGSWKKNTTYTAEQLHVGTGNWGNITLTATYDINYYNITWVVNGVSETVSVKYNTAPQHADPVITDDARYYYTFTGWDPAVELATKDATYTAQFDLTPKSYTVTWKYEDGTVYDSAVLKYGEDIPEKAVPAKEGYDGTWKQVYDTMPAFDYEITPNYTPKQYTIKWVNYDGTVLETDTADYDSTPVYNGATPTRATDTMYVYSFNGWSPAVSTVKGEATYTAQYKTIALPYEITWRLYNTDDVTYTDVQTSTLRYGDPITAMPSIPKIYGYAGSWVDVPETMPDHDLIIEGHYTYGAWTVTWYIDDATQSESIFMNGQTPVYTYATPTKNPTAEYTYTFAGWAATPGGEALETLPVIADSDVTYYAVFAATPNSYTVTWKADGAVVTSESVAYGTAIPTVNVPEKTGYTGVWDYKGTTMPARDLTINAVYTPIKYNVTWVVGDGEVSEKWDYDSTPVYTGSTDKTSSVTEDYKFIGWDKEIVPVTGDVTYTAVYEASARKYTITYVADGVTVDTQEVANGSLITLIPVPEKTGYTGVWGGVPSVMPANNITITAIYTPKNYTIKWITPAGETTQQCAYDSTPVYGGSTPVKESTAEKDFTFTGWSPEITTVTGDAVYTAQFSESARKYRVTYIADGQVITTLEVPFGDELPNPEIPEKEGFTASWNTGYRTMPAKDISVTAVYTARKYVISWKVDGLTVYTETLAYGKIIPTKELPEKVGYTGEWVTEYKVMPAKNITIEAVYTVNTYNIHWNVAGEKDSDVVTYGVDFEYTFIGADLPDDVRVTVKGKPITNYVYDKETGDFFLPGEAIVGDVNITERAAAGYNNVYITIGNGGSSNTAEVTQDGMAYFTQIYAPDGYFLPDTVNVYLDGVLITEGYTYDKETGKLTINAEIMNGELEIKATCPVNPDWVPPTPDEDDDENRGGLFGALLEFFENILNFFRMLFGVKV